MRMTKLIAATGAMLIAFGVSAGPAAAAVAPAAVQPTGVHATVTKLSHADATNRLSNAGITWSSSGGCSDRNNPTCTSFEQVNLSTIQGIITLKQSSGCAINITGGTETGHASGTYSHFNGYKLDIAHNGCIDGYIHSAFTRIGNRGDGFPQWQSGAGNIYCDEGSHWDITYFNCGGC